MKLGFRAVLAGVVLVTFESCSRAPLRQVVIYTALDELYSRPILDGFEARSGIKVVAVYDSESSKTTGLVNRLIAEQERPRADVFWNNEVAQTIVLQEKGVLAAYQAPARDAIPEQYRDADGYWTGFAARGRVIIYNTELVDTPPDSIEDLLDPQWKGRAAIAKPLFGTTATHGAALFALWGEERTKAFFAGLKENEIAVLPGNATVRDLVARGEYAWGLTDTDDANGGVLDGFPVKWLYPDQGEGQDGTLILPNTLALIKGGPNSEDAKKLIDFLLTQEIESRLARSRSMQIPLRTDTIPTRHLPSAKGIRTYPVSFEAIAGQMDTSMRYMQEEFLR